MNTVIRESSPVSRKVYDCGACIWLREYLRGQPRDTDLTISELRAVVKARRSGWKIQPGERYCKQVQKFEGDLTVFRYKPEIDAICHRLGLYGDWW